jgi:large subunit ribosomal protein L24
VPPRVKEAPRATKVPDIRSGDRVVVLTGKDAGKQGEVERLVRPDRIVVGGVNIAKRHTKPRATQGRNDRQPRVQQGGIVEVARPLNVSNVMVVCPHCSRPTRIKHDRGPDGRTTRVCNHCDGTLATGRTNA